ncbi:MAG: LAGLIDADG family homing endonuclease [Halobacteriales archaeon]|nr:LAGLIDADG family homing endonuclease [Halobacteriales archaeon]
MATVENTELVERFDQFYRNYYRDAIGKLAQRYPNEQRSLTIDWTDLYRFDQDLADDYVAQPDQLQEYAEEALRLYDLPVDVSLGQAHVRVQNLDAITDIRAIRAQDVNKLVSVSGIIRKATDVRPKVQEAAFECQRCGTLTYIPQSGAFQEPYECQGCERQGPFTINYDQSTFVDAQKLRVQESPEGLRGGETPQSIDVHIEDDLPGRVAPGDHVTLTGVLRIEQQTNQNQKSRMFDVHMEGHSLVIDDEEFEDMDITDEDKRDIVELSQRDDELYELFAKSVAPSIYGFDDEKLSMTFQLFAGVTKHLPDETRIRGDLHILLIGDPGTGKCVSGDTLVTLGDGSEIPIRELVEANLENPVPVDDGCYGDVDFEVPSLELDGSMSQKRATKVWKREAPDRLYRIRTASGREIEVTPSHPLYVQAEGHLAGVKAEDLNEGQFIATPRRVPTTGDDTLDVDFRRSRANNAVRFDAPDRWTPSLARLVGYVIAEGTVVIRDDHTGDVRVTNNDRAVLDDVAAALEGLGLPFTEERPKGDKSARRVRCNAGEFASFLANLEPAMLERSAEQRVPDAVIRSSPAIKRAFLRAYIEGEGTVSGKQREIAVGSMSRELLRGVKSLLTSLGIGSSLETRAGGSYRLRISGPDFTDYVTEIGFVTDRKSRAARAFDGVDENPNRDVVPNIGDELHRVRSALGLSQFDCGLPRSSYQHYERGDRNPSRASLRRVVGAFENRLAELRTLGERPPVDWETVRDQREAVGLSQAKLGRELGVRQTEVSQYERGVITDGGQIEAASAVIGEHVQDGLSVTAAVDRLRQLAESDVRWDRIEWIETVEPEDDWVYDLEVEGTHNYLTNGFVSHNSQLLQYIRNIAPRSVYTSGKGSSSAGLTAAAVKDDFGDGQQWSLEAGALVLADMGIAAVDELDKMRPEDRSAMHQALEQQEISISKAGINATLKARCALLGAANPKYGRFDQYEPIAEQIDLEPALISRFDLIFTVTDAPDEERDGELADHILRTNYAGELQTQMDQLASPTVTDEDVAGAAETVVPPIEPELFRKYVAYAKRNVFPSMTDEARQAIRDFYVNLRARGTGEDSPVPITARKLEALVRLAEASARVRLSDTVEIEDAERVIGIVRGSLKDIGVDPETGQFDADVIETGTSKTQRDRIKSIRALIKEIEGEYDEGAPVEEVLSRAAEAGIDESKVEHEIEKLRQRGEVYEPATGHLRTT